MAFNVCPKGCKGGIHVAGTNGKGRGSIYACSVCYIRWTNESRPFGAQLEGDGRPPPWKLCEHEMGCLVMAEVGTKFCAGHATGAST